jgi:hypothetical protein
MYVFTLPVVRYFVIFVHKYGNSGLNTITFHSFKINTDFNSNFLLLFSSLVLHWSFVESTELPILFHRGYTRIPVHDTVQMFYSSKLVNYIPLSWWSSMVYTEYRTWYIPLSWWSSMVYTLGIQDMVHPVVLVIIHGIHSEYRTWYIPLSWWSSMVYTLIIQDMVHSVVMLSGVVIVLVKTRHKRGQTINTQDYK